MPRNTIPLTLTLAAGAGTYQVKFTDWRGAPFDSREYTSLHKALDDALIVVALKAARRMEDSDQ